MTVTPVANCDSARRNSDESKPRVSARGKLVFIGALNNCSHYATAGRYPQDQAATSQN
jgi:hypothetical protein